MRHNSSVVEVALRFLKKELEKKEQRLFAVFNQSVVNSVNLKLVNAEIARKGK